MAPPPGDAQAPFNAIIQSRQGALAHASAPDHAQDHRTIAAVDAALGTVVRQKTVEIANARLAEGKDEGKPIRIAIAKANERVRHHGCACATMVDADLPSIDQESVRCSPTTASGAQRLFS
ncbi:MAG: hypothetical protein ACRC2B_13775 [Rubrivivax sp.]